MDTFLLTWDPNEEDEEDKWNRKAAIDECRAGGKHFSRWSCGGTKSIPVGSRVFLMQVGGRPGERGLIGSGLSVERVSEGPHWKSEKRAWGEMARYIRVLFDVLADHPLVTHEDLRRQPFSGVGRWSGGTQIPPAAASALEELWRSRIEPEESPATTHPDAAHLPAMGVEGGQLLVTVNRYERDTRLREACLQHYGRACCVCAMTFATVYGDGFKDASVHVHHLEPLGQGDGPREVNAIRDLRPVCPNCHTAIHARRDRPFTPEEVRERMKDQARRPPAAL